MTHEERTTTIKQEIAKLKPQTMKRSPKLQRCHHTKNFNTEHIVLLSFHDKITKTLDNIFDGSMCPITPSSALLLVLKSASVWTAPPVTAISESGWNTSALEYSLMPYAHHRGMKMEGIPLLTAPGEWFSLFIFDLIISVVIISSVVLYHLSLH